MKKQKKKGARRGAAKGGNGPPFLGYSRPPRQRSPLRLGEAFMPDPFFTIQQQAAFDLLYPDQVIPHLKVKPLRPPFPPGVLKPSTRSKNKRRRG